MIYIEPNIMDWKKYSSIININKYMKCEIINEIWFMIDYIIKIVAICILKYLSHNSFRDMQMYNPFLTRCTAII